MEPKTQSNSLEELIQARRQKLQKLLEEGQNPYAQSWSPSHTAAELPAVFEAQEKSTADTAVESGAQPMNATAETHAASPMPEALSSASKACADAPKDPSKADLCASSKIALAGRIVALRLMGKSAFIKLLDSSGAFQIYLARDKMPEGRYKQLVKEQLDLGDIIGAEGSLFRTKTGELTLKAETCLLLSKALRPLPEKWHGLTDSEQIYRQRHLDLICNPKSRDRFAKRSAIIQEIRKQLWERDFIEVETPCLHPIAGGAAARPFKTHANALDCDFYLRIALELHLKRLLVGGMDRVFELGRVFRNEGLSRRHNPEFTMLEVYQAYGSLESMKQLIQGLVQHLCANVIGSFAIENSEGQTLQLDGPWREATYAELILDATQDSEYFNRSNQQKRATAEKFGLELASEVPDFLITHEIYEKRIEPTLIQPTFVTKIPAELCPLAKRHPDNDGTLDVFELCINGQEIAPAYNEQNDPIAQRRAFEEQVGEEVQSMDEDFLQALEYGMPPAAGMGVGIDRLVILLSEAANIRDTILFPALRPKN